MLRRLALPLMWLAIWTQVAWGQVVFDAAATGTAANAASLTFAHTVGAGGTNRVLIVGVSIDNRTVTGVTYAGVAMTSVGSVANGAQISHLWRLVNPATGANDVAITLSGGGTDIVGCAISVTGAHQTSPVGTFASATGTSTAVTVNVTSAADELVVDMASVDAGALTVGAGQDSRCNATAGDNQGGGSTEAGAGTVTMSWTSTVSSAWATGGVSVKVAAAGASRLRMMQGMGR
mgnify:CR=1 FL=1